VTAARDPIPDLKEVLGVVASQNGRITPGLLVERLCAGGKRTRGEARAVVRLLVDQGVLCYNYVYGISFLERTFAHPVSITETVVLKPPKTFFPETDDKKVINIEPGAAFGGGQHPTTRLALEAMGWCFDRHPKILIAKAGIGIDIGTGTGVLAIAAVKFGLQRVMATEIDPVACWEARRNVALNGLSERVLVRACPHPPLDQNAILVTANLRLPSLVDLRDAILEAAAPEAVLIFSGIRPGELPQLLSAYSAGAVDLIYRKTEHNWSCAAFKKHCSR
jgi:ribosomal protein L11 methyltransferase